MWDLLRNPPGSLDASQPRLALATAPAPPAPPKGDPWAGLTKGEVAEAYKILQQVLEYLHPE
jgi:hypothetical protein